MTFEIITIFPNIFNSYFSESIIKRAQKNKKIKIKIHDLRKYTTDKHKTIDDKPYGGGVGMIMKVEPAYKALQKIGSKKLTPEFIRGVKKQMSHPSRHQFIGGERTRIILFTPTGKTFDQKTARRLAKYDQLIMLCPRYEGHDARIEKLVDEKISIGDYVLTGGEIPAMILVDSITRLIPGVINKESLKQESFSTLKTKNLKLKIEKEYPQYTRPEKFQDTKVPKILLSGNHKKIQEWKQKNSKIKK